MKNILEMALIISDSTLRSLQFGDAIVSSTSPRDLFPGITLNGAAQVLIRGGRMPDRRLLEEVALMVAEREAITAVVLVGLI